MKSEYSFGFITMDLAHLIDIYHILIHCHLFYIDDGWISW